MKPETIFFERREWVPNSRLPVLFYRRAIDPDHDAAGAFERRFAQNGWTGLWRNGVFAYQHYHTRAHEVLGIAAGSAALLIGGPGGKTLDVSAGDCIVLPAGTGHCRLEASRNFLVIGGYPPGQQADICTREPGADGLEAIAAVPLPRTDPIEGEEGALCVLWRQGAGGSEPHADGKPDQSREMPL